MPVFDVKIVNYFWPKQDGEMNGKETFSVLYNTQSCTHSIQYSSQAVEGEVHSESPQGDLGQSHTHLA